LTGEVKEIGADVRDGYVHFEAELGPADSRLYIWNTTQDCRPPTEAEAGSKQPKNGGESVEELGPVTRFSRTMPNLLTIDTCSYRIADQGWSDETDVWQAQKAVREALGMRQVYSNGLEQRYKWINEPHLGNGTPVQFKFSFQVSVLPLTEVYLVLESAEYYEIQLNGEAISNHSAGWFLDRSFDKVFLRGLREGKNELVLSCGYHNRMEVEDIYVIGDFGVDTDRRIAAEPQTLSFGDWCTQGYFHYCGSMIYHFDITAGSVAETRTVLELGRYSAVTIEVRVNDKTVGHVPWRAANRLDLTEHLLGGENRIEIEVMGSPRNMLGPFHHTSGDPSTTSWASFRKTGDDYNEAYTLRPYGLFGDIKLYRG
jgi:hypothetical protein